MNGVMLHDGRFMINGVLFDKHEFKIVNKKMYDIRSAIMTSKIRLYLVVIPKLYWNLILKEKVKKCFSGPANPN